MLQTPCLKLRIFVQNYDFFSILITDFNFQRLAALHIQYVIGTWKKGFVMSEGILILSNVIGNIISFNLKIMYSSKSIAALWNQNSIRIQK